MKKFALMLATLLAPFLAGADSIEGNITLKYTDSAFSDDSFKKEFGNVIKATCGWYAGEFFGKETVFAGVSLKNTGSKPMTYHYYVAFYDKDKKLIGTAAQGSFGNDGIEPGKGEQLGSCLIHLPKGKYKEIASYQAVLYESEAAPQKKK